MKTQLNNTNHTKANSGAIFFDGLCILCSREIEHYRKQAGSENFSFIDITDASFDPEAHGVDPFAVHKVMHVKDRNGKLYTGVEAFRAIWKELPRYRFLHSWTRHEFVKSVMKLGYNGFVRIRPILPRRKANCDASPYCETKHRNPQVKSTPRR